MGKKVAILTDSNSGITQEQGKALGIPVIPMPFYIDDKLFYEDITLTQEQFYKYLETDAEIHTSMPVVGDVLDRWNSLLKEYDEIVYIPMSSGLSSSCATARTLAEDFDGRVRKQPENLRHAAAVCTGCPGAGPSGLGRGADQGVP